MKTNIFRKYKQSCKKIEEIINRRLSERLQAGEFYNVEIELMGGVMREMLVT